MPFRERLLKRHGKQVQIKMSLVTIREKLDPKVKAVEEAVRSFDACKHS